MTMAKELREIAAEIEGAGNVLTEDHVLDACRDANRFPELNGYIWGESVDTLLLEARRARARSVIMRLKFVTEDGDRVRLLTHVPGVKGYSDTETVAANFDLAPVKLRQFAKELRLAHARFSAFKRMIAPEIAAELDEAIARATKMADEAAEAAETRSESAA